MEAENSNFCLKIFKIKNQPKIDAHLISYSQKGVYINFQEIWIIGTKKIAKIQVPLYFCGGVYMTVEIVANLE